MEKKSNNHDLIDNWGKYGDTNLASLIILIREKLRDLNDKIIVIESILNKMENYFSKEIKKKEKVPILWDGEEIK